MLSPSTQLSHRPEVLELLSDRIAAAWASFDAPRPAEPDLAEDLERRFADPLPRRAGDLADALGDATSVLEASVSPSRPLFTAYIGSTGLEVGVLAAALAATYDVNLASNAGGAELVERQALDWVGQFLGVPHRHGAFTSGGMTSNLSALLAARERALPGAREHGVAGRQGTVYCSAEAHHSVVRAVETIGLGGAALRRVAIDERRRMRAGELDRALRSDREQGLVPVAVVATAGTTLSGAIDPLDELAEVCERHGVWLHIDGAYGLAAAAVPAYEPRFAGREGADSLSFDAHKWLGLQKSCSVVLLRDEEALDAAFGHRARYMLQPEGRRNPVDRTFEYSRPLRSLKLWLAFRVHGADALAAGVARTLELTDLLVAELRADARFRLLLDPQLSTVCFQHLPAEGGDVDEHNRRLAEAVRRDGRAYVAAAEVDGRTCLRVTLVNFRTQEADVLQLLDVLRELGDGPTEDRRLRAPGA